MNAGPATDRRRLLLEAYAAALAAVEGAAVTRAALAGRDGGPLEVVAVGKAAAAMARGAREALGADIRRLLVITKSGHDDGELFARPGVTRLEAAHPVPDATSLAAGTALVDFVAAGPADLPLLFLVSGGTSSLVERLPPGIDLDLLARANRWLLGSGLDIHAVNRVRRALSLIKGGRLLAHVGERPATVLLISDVPGDDPQSIGSGPLWPAAPDDLADLDLPDWLRTAVGQTHAAAPPVPQRTVEHRVIAANRHALEAAARSAGQHGLEVHLHAELLRGDAATTGRRLLEQAWAPGLHLWGGETTVTLPPQPGRGGRCQHLALAAALAGAGQDGWCLLAAGTDGSDGPGDEAGALVDGTTITRATDAGLDPAASLAAADSGRFLEAAGDLVHTGPTGTNVMDVVMMWREA